MRQPLGLPSTTTLPIHPRGGVLLPPLALLSAGLCRGSAAVKRRHLSHKPQVHLRGWEGGTQEQHRYAVGRYSCSKRNKWCGAGAGAVMSGSNRGGARANRRPPHVITRGQPAPVTLQSRVMFFGGFSLSDAHTCFPGAPALPRLAIAVCVLLIPVLSLKTE